MGDKLNTLKNILKGIGKSISKPLKALEVFDGTYGIIREVFLHFENQEKIVSILDGAIFDSEKALDAHEKYLKKKREEELKALSVAEQRQLREQYELEYKIAALEKRRRAEIRNSKAKLDKSSEVKITTGEYFKKALFDKSPIQQRIKHAEELTKINYEYDNLILYLRGEIDKVNSFWLDNHNLSPSTSDIIITPKSGQKASPKKNNIPKINSTPKSNSISLDPYKGLINNIENTEPFMLSSSGSVDINEEIKKIGAIKYNDSLSDFVKNIKESTQNLQHIKELVDHLNSDDKDSERKDIADKLGITEEGLKRIEDSLRVIEALNKAIKPLGIEIDSSSKNSFKTFIDDINQSLKKIEKGGYKNITEGFSGLTGTIKKKMPALTKFGEDIDSIFNSSVGGKIGGKINEYVNNSVSVLSSALEVGTGVGKVFKGDVSGIIDVASGLGKIFGNSKKVNEEHKKALKLLEQNRNQQEHLYKLEQLRADLAYKKGTTVFGSDSWGKATNAAGTYQKAINNLNESLKGDGKVKSKGFLGFLSTGIKQSDYAALENIDIVNGSKKSGWGPWKKRKDVYEGILSVYPDLIDSEGKFNATLAQTIVNTRQMSDANKASLQQMIDNAKEVEAIYAEMKNYLTSIFGAFGDQITDAFVDSFKNGTDAMGSFTKNAGAMLENLVKDMVYSMALAPIIEEASKKMEAIMQNTDISEEERLNSYGNIVGTLVDDLVDQQSYVDQILGSAQESAKKHGIDIFQADPREGITGQGIAAMSQDSANELNGNFTALLQQTAFIRDLNNQSLLVQRTMESHLNRVADNTEYCRYLENVKNSLEDIQLRGVKMKV